MIRTLLFFFFLLVLAPIRAQDEKKEYHHPFIPDTLFPISALSDEEMEKQGEFQRGKDFGFYTHEGDELSMEEAFGSLQEREKVGYIDSNYRLQAMVLLPAEKDRGGSVGGLKEAEREAPEGFELPLLEGGTLGFERGKEREEILVLNFWFIDCKPCKMEIPELNELVEGFKGKAVRFVSVTIDEKKELENFLKEEEFAYEHGLDPERELNGRFGVDSYPTHAVIDRNGELCYFEAGYAPGRVERLENSIEHLMEEGP